MRAFICDRYGSPDVLRLEEVEKPVPQDDQVLVKIEATSVNAGDWHILRADPFLMRLAFGLTKPKIRILGLDIAGTVEARGDAATRFEPGEDVFGDISVCGFGAFAEYACVPEHVLARKPANVSFEEAAAVPAAGVTALQGLRDKGKVKVGDRVAINGASGGVGTFAVQLAKHFGAEVTAICSTRKMDRVRALGADHVVDYTQEDFTRNGIPYDLIVAANGNNSIFDYQRALAPGGRYVSTGGSLKQFLQAALIGPVLSMASGKSFNDFLVKPNGADVAFMAGLLESGAIAPVIDRRLAFHEIPEGIRYVEQGHAPGKVVVRVGEG